MRAAYTLLLSATLASCAPASVKPDSIMAVYGTSDNQSVVLNNTGNSNNITGSCIINGFGQVEILISNPNDKPTYCVAGCNYHTAHSSIDQANVEGQSLTPVPAGRLNYIIYKSDNTIPATGLYSKLNGLACGDHQMTLKPAEFVIPKPS